MGWNRPLRILHLEDDPNDVELVGATLEADGLDCDRKVTSTREEFVSVLEQGNPDLVLSDFYGSLFSIKPNVSVQQSRQSHCLAGLKIRNSAEEIHGKCSVQLHRRQNS